MGLSVSRSHDVQMTSGSLFKNVLAFTVPLILSGMLQLLYNSADIIVVGRFADSLAMAAVGSTTSLIQLMVSLLMGLSVGSSVAVARAAGAKDDAAIHRAVERLRGRFITLLFSANPFQLQNAPHSALKLLSLPRKALGLPPKPA